MTDLFRAKAPKVMADLMRDFDLSVEDAAAILGNLAHECNGFRTLQETKPTVAGSRGGWGWAQWTGPRRRQFEAWCLRKAYSPSSDVANYSFLYRELKGLEGEPSLKAVKATKAASGLRAKVIAFELAFLRAGIKHYDSRTEWALRAMKAWTDNKVPPPPDVEPVDGKPQASPALKLLIGGVVTALAALAAYLGIDLKGMIP